MNADKVRIFLLGGYDLEMQEIENLLIENACTYYNASLKWSDAKLSSYIDVIKPFYDGNQSMIYGIELMEDIPVPDNYVKIDHHNEYSSRPSSLVQVASLLGVELSRRQHLIAANDVGYISAMASYGATQSEIEEIRLADRCAQGITGFDELLGVLSIDRYMQQSGSLVIVKSLTPHFATISDRLYPFERLIIYTDAEMTYYGDKVPELKLLFAHEIKARKMYYGGNDRYLGVAFGTCTAIEIIEIINRIKIFHNETV